MVQKQYESLTMSATMSSVCWTRNDNLRNMPYRCLMHIQSAIKEFDEVIVVDWCSSGKTFIQECYDYLPKTGKIKSIQVTEDLIKSVIPNPLKFSDLSPTITNVGIRRATSDFILATTADVIANRPDLSVLNDTTMYVNGRRGVPEKDYCKFDTVDDLREYLFTNYEKYPNSPDSVSVDGKQYGTDMMYGHWLYVLEILCWLTKIFGIPLEGMNR